MDDDGRATSRRTGVDRRAAAELGDAAVLALWLTAWLRDEVSLDDARDAVVGDDAAHDVVGLDSSDPLAALFPGAAEGAGDSVPLILALGRLRSLGTTSASLSLPVPGDPTGLAGPPAFNAEALEAEQAVVLHGSGRGLVPARAGAGVVWRCLPASPPPPSEGVAEADRVLRRTLTLAADALVDLDVARWRPEVADELMDLRSPSRLPVPSGLPGRHQALLALAVRCRRVVGLALEDDGGSVTAGEARRRREALLPLDVASRRALVAVCDPARDG